MMLHSKHNTLVDHHIPVTHKSLPFQPLHLQSLEPFLLLHLQLPRLPLARSKSWPQTGDEPMGLVFYHECTAGLKTAELLIPTSTTTFNFVISSLRALPLPDSRGTVYQSSWWLPLPDTHQIFMLFLPEGRVHSGRRFHSAIHERQESVNSLSLLCSVGSCCHGECLRFRVS